MPAKIKTRLKNFFFPLKHIRQLERESRVTGKTQTRIVLEGLELYFAREQDQSHGSKPA